MSRGDLDIAPLAVIGPVVGNRGISACDGDLLAELHPDGAIVANKRQTDLSFVSRDQEVERTQSTRVDVLPAIRRIFMENAHAPLLSEEPMNEVISGSVAQQRFSMILLCGFGIISLVVGAAGLYGVMSYTVARQTREIGVRMALGARREDVAGMVLKDAGMLVGIGLVIGIAASLLGAKIVGSLLFGVKPRDPLTLATALVLLSLTGLSAAWWPVRRAARVEPMEALRSE